MKNKISVMLVEYTDVTDVFWYKGHKGTRVKALVKMPEFTFVIIHISMYNFYTKYGRMCCFEI